jgi:hypothetical protein
MSWQLVLTILAGWAVIPALAWALAHEILRLVRYDHQSISGTGGSGSGSGRFHLMQFRQIQR